MLTPKEFFVWKRVNPVVRISSHDIVSCAIKLVSTQLRSKKADIQKMKNAPRTLHTSSLPGRPAFTRATLMLL